ncbi:MAG: methionine synthase [Bacteroidetes bacterium]|nr:methionine synthase [Bacteroidota bacterium]
MKTFLELLTEKVIVFDGATGTQLQSQHLTTDDFGGEQYVGCNEYLVLSKPSAVERVHVEYLEAGSDVIETNTFGATAIVLSEYGLQERVYEINYKAAQLAKHLAQQYSRQEQPRFVAGSVGPGTKLPSLGHISFRELVSAYEEQVRALLTGGVDLLCIETCQDILQTKAALFAVQQTFTSLRMSVPVIVSLTIETTGTMLVGTDLLAALSTLESFDCITSIGLNCATGPEEMVPHVRTLTAHSPKPVLVMPNAGMPEIVKGHAQYKLSPEAFMRTLTTFVTELGVNIVGGCCGTTPEHIHHLAMSVRNLTPRMRTYQFVPAVASLYQAVPLRIDNPPLLIGERTNANGSKQFRELLLREDWEGMVAIGKQQVDEGAHLLDVSVAYVGRNEAKDFRELIPRLNRQLQVPLMIDSTDPLSIEEALQHVSGKPIINSVNLEDGESKVERIAYLCKQYGAAVVALTIDEEGMAKTAERKIAVAHRLYNILVKKFGLHPHDLIFDPLTFTLATGDEEFRRAALETIEAIRRIKQEFPQCYTSLGISNVSYGLKPAIRQVLNSVFLHYAVEAGLDMAIVHASKILPLYRIDERGRELARKLIFDERQWEDGKSTGKLLFDPLAEFITYYEANIEERKETDGVQDGTVEQRLQRKIIDGILAGLEVDLNEALKSYTALEIINTILLEAMKKVGDLFGSGQMQLPFVLQSAEVMKKAVAFLEPYIEKKSDTKKGKLVLATVKGDVHDIGKNLVDIILTNNGYTVYNLGIKCPIEQMIEVALAENADAIGMSGLLVKSTQVMKENLVVLNERKLSIPVILGGAALTRRFVENELRPLYAGEVYYAHDAFDGLHIMEAIIHGEIQDQQRISVDEQNSDKDDSFRQVEHFEKFTSRSVSICSSAIPQPPFWGSRIVTDISLDEVYRYINQVALFRGQWRIVRGKRTEEEYRKILEEQIIPEFEVLKQQAKEQKLLQPSVVYGYFPCQSDGDELIIYEAPESNTPLGELRASILPEIVRFTFPRQRTGKHLCISDFFASVDSGVYDVVAFHLVTMGNRATEYAHELYRLDHYKEYLFFHGFSVEATEALAEYWHRKIREELNIHQHDDPDITKLFSQKYQGARYSFGYPACPNLEDHKKLFMLLHPERIGVTLTESYMLNPEQSTDAIIVHHPEARYFKV